MFQKYLQASEVKEFSGDVFLLLFNNWRASFYFNENKNAPTVFTARALGAASQVQMFILGFHPVTLLVGFHPVTLLAFIIYR
jgi:hypothetical protein